MIRLHKVTKYYRDETTGHEVVLRDVSFIFPTDRPVALLGADEKVVSSLLLMLSGSVVPDKGEVRRGRLRCSPLINASGMPGVLIGHFSGSENVRRLAELYGADAHRLIALVEAACGLGKLLEMPVRTLLPQKRRSLEVAAIAALPFDCYFADRVQLINPELMSRLLHAARMRGAGVIFSSQRLRQAFRLADIGAVAADGALHWAHNPREILATYGQAG